MKKNPLVSVIMSEYNTDKMLLEESIKSILNQDYDNLELILIDDCGKNDISYLHELFNDKRLKIIKNENNMGLVASLNKALKYSKGKYIARMDTDDFSYPNRISRQIEFMESNTSIDIIGANADYYDGEKIWATTRLGGIVNKDLILNACPFIHPSVMYKKSSMNKIGGYLDYNRCEDYATWIEMYINGFKMYNLTDVLIRYHLSYEDYKKSTLKNRKGFFKMLNTQYKKLNPTYFQVLKVRIKKIIAGVIPDIIMFQYHKRKLRK